MHITDSVCTSGERLWFSREWSTLKAPSGANSPGALSDPERRGKWGNDRVGLVREIALIGEASAAIWKRFRLCFVLAGALSTVFWQTPQGSIVVVERIGGAVFTTNSKAVR